MATDMELLQTESSLINGSISTPELLQEIFSYLEVKDLKNVRLVGKGWREVTFNPCLNNNIRVSMNYRDAHDISKMKESGFSISGIRLWRNRSHYGFCITDFWSHYGSGLKMLKLDSPTIFVDEDFPFIFECCPSLETLHLRHCSLRGLDLDKVKTGMQLKELFLERTYLSDLNVVSLVSLLAPGLTRFLHHPYYRNLTTKESNDIFRLVSNTLTEVSIGWARESEEDEDVEVNLDLDFDVIFNVPGLKLKKVTLQCDFYFDAMLNALVVHQGNFLEEICIADDAYVADEVLQRYLLLNLPNLRKFSCRSPYNNDDKWNTLISLLGGTADSHTALREIDVDDFVLLTRKTASEKFAPIELSVEYDGDSVEAHNDAVAAFLVLHSLNLLTKLVLVNIDFDLSVQGLVNIIFERCVNLLNLSLRRCNLSDAMLINGLDQGNETPDWETGSFPIMNLSLLESLDLYDNEQLTSYSITRVIKFPHLKTIILGKSDSICDDRFKHLALNNPGLEVVKFSELNLTDNPIIEFVQNAPNLVKLDMHLNPLLTDNALRDVSQLGKLKKLDVAGCPLITKECLISVSENNAALRVVRKHYDDRGQAIL